MRRPRWHNFTTVLAFEFRRTVARPQFWVLTLAIPLMILALLGLVVLSNLQAHLDSVVPTDPVPFTYADASGLVDADVARRLGGTPTADPDAAARAVREGRADLHIEVPADPLADAVVVVGRDLGLAESPRWADVAERLVAQSVEARIGDPRLAELARGGVALDLQLWADGEQAAGWGGVLAPGAFLALLYLTVLMLGQQMLNITVEEKENRVTEMILTTIRPEVLIAGKVVAVVGIGLVQGCAFLVSLVAYSALGAAIGDPTGLSAATGVEGRLLSGLVGDVSIEPGPVLMGAALFVGGFLLFTGLLLATGAVMPTAREAGTAYAVVVLGMLIPLYTGPMLVSSPDALATRVMTYFPLTAPVAALARNAVGNLGPAEAAVTLVVLYGSALGFLALGVRLFREGSISYDARLQVAKVLRQRRSRP